ncbi:MAG: 23S rRNA (adenine(2503)-C(2))-methyltransferase RlmN [Solirubrobacterales bacterium]
MERTELLGMTQGEMEDFMASAGEARFRGRQVYRWVYVKNTGSFYDMSDLPRSLREKLDQLARISIPKVVKARTSNDGTRKFLLELSDKKRIETVAIPQKWEGGRKYTVCVSTQAGCPIGCAFCATGQSGFDRDLTAGEIVGQVIVAEREMRRREKHTAEDRIVTNLVFMGMGEPLLNLDAVLEAVALLNDAKGMNLGQRHMTISTAGLVPGIDRLAERELQLTLALSLHAVTDTVRNQLVPLNQKYGIRDVLAAVRRYTEKTGRRSTIEYVLLSGVNDRPEDADRLASLLKSMLVNVNLIPYNPVEGTGYDRPAPESVRCFLDRLTQAGIAATVREEMGNDIEAACGQLRARRTT